ncbi:MAG: response regulator, partial [Cyanobacteriota bacterium]|nr:response regulator [Cyanobacteriota bacterium]
MAANKVLIVDKNSEMRTKIREMLPSGNFQVLEAIDGEEAMSMLDLQRKGLRLVIFNFQLPAVSGWEILKKVQTDGNLQKVATIILGDRVDDIQAVVPPPYFEYIEVLETTCDRKTLHKAMKSAVGKTKVARQPLPTEPLVAPLSVDEVPTPPPPTEETPDLLDLDLESLTIEATESEESLAPEPEVKLEEELPAFSTELPVESTKKIDSQNPFSSAELEDVGENSLNPAESSTNSHADPFSSAGLEDVGENSLDLTESSTNSHADPFSSAELE